MTLELSRPISIDRLPATIRVVATPIECAALALRLGIPAVQALSCGFTLGSRGNLVQAEGALVADVVQSCVVSLEPVEQHVAERFTIHFVPSGRETDDDDPETPDEIPYEGTTIDLGEAVAEQLALALDPYPRLPGAELDPAAHEADVTSLATLLALRDHRRG